MRPFDPALAATYPAVIGCDEVGRGALCGPVVVAAAWFDPRAVSTELLRCLDDSKRLTVKQRACVVDQVEAAVRTGVLRLAIAASAAKRIDERGIRTMTLDAMRRAVARVGITAPVRIDGIDVPEGMPADTVAVVRGESVVPQIAAASVVAKTCRDRLMARLAARHPNYRWEQNAGYGTAAHLDALTLLGPTPHHRQSFKPVLQASRRPGELRDKNHGIYPGDTSGGLTARP